MSAVFYLTQLLLMSDEIEEYMGSAMAEWWIEFDRFQGVAGGVKEKTKKDLPREKKKRKKRP